MYVVCFLFFLGLVKCFEVDPSLGNKGQHCLTIMATDLEFYHGKEN